jgi:hypothetical protein
MIPVFDICPHKTSTIQRNTFSITMTTMLSHPITSLKIIKDLLNA